MDLTDAGVKELVMNESFQQWILEPDEDIDTFWKNWLEHHPEREEIVKKARRVVQSIRTSLEEEIDNECAELWSSIEQHIDAYEIVRNVIKAC